MTILITGASGFLGGRLVNTFTKQNKKVRIFARKGSNLSNLDLSNVEVRVGDLSDTNSIHGLMDDIDIVFHCAAKIGLGRTEDFNSTNIDGTDNLLQEAVRADVDRFIHISSIAVMSEYLDHLGSNEDEPYAQWWSEPYTPSKIEAEKVALRYSKNGHLNVLVIRPGWIWGPGDINTFNIGKAVIAGLAPCVGSGNNILPLTYIDNLIHALLLVQNKPCVSGDIFIINDDQDVTQKQLVQAFVDRLNPSAKSISIPFQLAYKIAHTYELINKVTLWRLSTTLSRFNTCIAAKNLKFSVEKAKRILDFDPPIDFNMAINETIKWFYDMYLEKNSRWDVHLRGVRMPLIENTSMAHFAISSWCNAHCVFCSYPGSTERIAVNLADAIKAINALKRLGVGLISLTGGEPFLNNDIFRIAYHASSIGMFVFTGTNGSSMTEDDAFRLQRAGVRAIWISYEGATDEVFDKNRGVPGLSQKIRMDLKWLRNAGVDTFAICIINKSITNYRKFIDHLIDIGFDKVKFDYPMINLESSYLGFKDLGLLHYTPNEMEDVIAQILELKRSKYRSFGIINPTVGLEGAMDFYRNHKPRFGCAAGYRIFYLDWNLDLYRCTMLPEKFGKVWDVSPEKLHRIDCNKCYYQGTRDYDSVYHLIDSIGSSKDSVIQGDIPRAISSIFNNNNLSGFKSLFEIAGI
jgi:nucleoside-diphosphate-sugar epimerase/MoaA/NifB/PqqE/SkfB family radical SAM enzyme